jgi:hypothetical protein
MDVSWNGVVYVITLVLSFQLVPTVGAYVLGGQITRVFSSNRERPDCFRGELVVGLDGNWSYSYEPPPDIGRPRRTKGSGGRAFAV